VPRMLAQAGLAKLRQPRQYRCHSETSFPKVPDTMWHALCCVVAPAQQPEDLPSDMREATTCSSRLRFQADAPLQQPPAATPSGHRSALADARCGISRAMEMRHSGNRTRISPSRPCAVHKTRERRACRFHVVDATAAAQQDHDAFPGHTGRAFGIERAPSRHR